MKRQTVRRALAGLALAAGVLAAVAGSPRQPLRDDEISAVDLARRLRDRGDGLLVIDVRAAGEADRPHVAGARSLAEFDPAAVAAGSAVVIYAEGDIGDAAFDALRGRFAGLPLQRLRGGIGAWNDEVLFPSVRAGAPPRAERDFLERAALSRYFGGTPRRLAPGEAPSHERSRRGC